MSDVDGFFGKIKDLLCLLKEERQEFEAVNNK